MNKVKKVLAVMLAVALMFPSAAVNAVESPAPQPIKSVAKNKAVKDTVRYTGTGKKMTITVGGKALKEGKDFKFVGKKPKNVGKYKVKIKGIGAYKGTYTVTITIKKAKQPFMKISNKAEKKLAKGFTASEVKKKGKKVNLGINTKGAKRTFTVRRNGKKVSAKKITVSKSGVVTLKKGIKKGIYTIKVKISGTKNFKGGTKTIKFEVR